MTQREATRDIRGATIVEVTIFRLQLKGVATGGFGKKASAVQRDWPASKSLPFLLFFSCTFARCSVRAIERGRCKLRGVISTVFSRDRAEKGMLKRKVD